MTSAAFHPPQGRNTSVRWHEENISTVLSAPWSGWRPRIRFGDRDSASAGSRTERDRVQTSRKSTPIVGTAVHVADGADPHRCRRGVGGHGRYGRCRRDLRDRRPQCTTWVSSGVPGGTCARSAATALPSNGESEARRQDSDHTLAGTWRPGTSFLLEAGNHVPADCRLLDAIPSANPGSRAHRRIRARTQGRAVSRLLPPTHRSEIAAIWSTPERW